MTISPWLAYDAMIVAYNEKRFHSAYDLASALLEAIRTPGTGGTRWFKRKKLMNILVIEHEAGKHIGATLKHNLWEEAQTP